MKTLVFLLAFLILSFINLFSQWERIDERIIGDNDDAVSMIAANNDVVVVGSHRGSIYISLDKGTTWKKNYALSYKDQIMDIKLNNKYIFVSFLYKLFRSSNLGESWTELERAKYCNLCQLYTENNDLYFGGEQNIYKSTDLGDKWGQMTKDDTPTIVISQIITHDTSVILHLKSIGISKYQKDSTWIKSDNGIPEGCLDPLSFLFHYGNKLLFNSCDDIYIADDSLTKWSLLYSAPEIFDSTLNKSIKSKISHVTPCGTTLFAELARHNIAYSTDTCKSWKSFNYGLEDLTDRCNVRAFAINDSYIYMIIVKMPWPYEYSTYRAKLKDCVFDSTGLSVDDKAKTETKKIIYPNPANDFINLPSEINGAAVQSAILYNLIGETVLNCQFSQDMDETIRLDVSNLGTGLYYLVCKSKNDWTGEKIIISR